MTTFAKTMTALVIGLSAAMLAPVAGEVQAASLIGQCQQQVAHLWPQVGREYERTKEYVLNACVANGGRIPG
jgi:hypothetical protein